MYVHQTELIACVFKYHKQIMMGYGKYLQMI